MVEIRGIEQLLKLLLVEIPDKLLLLKYKRDDVFRVINRLWTAGMSCFLLPSTTATCFLLPWSAQEAQVCLCLGNEKAQS